MEAVVKYYRQAVTKMEFMHDEEGLTKLGENSFVPDRDGWELTSYDTERRDASNVWGGFLQHLAAEVQRINGHFLLRLSVS